LLTERYKFKERKQGSDEMIYQFVTSLIKLSQFCEFGVNLNDSLRDQVVYGIKDVNIKKPLLSETKLTFKRSVELCLSMEAADKDVSEWGSQELNYQKFVKTKSNKSVKDWGKRANRKLKRRSHRTTRVCLVKLYVFVVVLLVILNQAASINHLYVQIVPK